MAPFSNHIIASNHAALSLGCAYLRTLHHPIEPRSELTVEAVPLMHARTTRPIIVEDVALFVTYLPEGVQRTLHVRRNSAPQTISR